MLHILKSFDISTDCLGWNVEKEWWPNAEMDQGKQDFAEQAKKVKAMGTGGY